MTINLNSQKKHYSWISKLVINQIGSFFPKKNRLIELLIVKVVEENKPESISFHWLSTIKQSE